MQQHTKGVVDSFTRFCIKFYTLSNSERILKMG